MSGTRRKAREMAMQMLYQSDLGKQTANEVRRVFWKSRTDDDGQPTVDLETQSFAEDLFRIAMERSDEVDDLIEQHAKTPHGGRGSQSSAHGGRGADRL